MIQITTLRELSDLVQDKKAVRKLSGSFTKHTPAAWVMSMSGRCILQLLTAGLYLYVKGCTCEKPGDICPKCFEQIKPIEF